MGSDDSTPTSKLRVFAYLHNSPLPKNSVTTNQPLFTVPPSANLDKNKIEIVYAESFQDKGARNKYQGNADCWKKIKEDGKYYKYLTFAYLAGSMLDWATEIGKYKYVTTPVSTQVDSVTVDFSKYV